MVGRLIELTVGSVTGFHGLYWSCQSVGQIGSLAGLEAIPWCQQFEEPGTGRVGWPGALWPVASRGVDRSRAPPPQTAPHVNPPHVGRPAARVAVPVMKTGRRLSAADFLDLTAR